MKKILIALDYNPVSEKVVEAGYRLAKQLGAEVCLLHVVTHASYYGMTYPDFMGYTGFEPSSVNLNMVSEMHKIAENFLKSAADHLNDPNVKTHLTEGSTAETILNYSEEWKADMLVMGTHSHSVLEKIFIGSVASSIIEETKIPVYLVPVKKEE